MWADYHHGTDLVDCFVPRNDVLTCFAPRNDVLIGNEVLIISSAAHSYYKLFQGG